MNKKVVVIGNARTNKTVSVHGLFGNHGINYVPTLGTETHCFTSVNGNKYNIWDCAGQSNYGGLRDAYYIQADIAIICSGGNESSNPNHYHNKTVAKWVEEVVRVSPNAQIFHIHNIDTPTLRGLLA